MNGPIAFVFIFSVIVGFHEGAHFLLMKLFGIKVLRFSIGFGPVLLRKKIGETEYQIAAIPLGGYVMPLTKGMPAQAGFAKEPDDSERYFESKPAWQRMLTYLVGPLSNLLFAFLIYFVLFATVGSFYATTKLSEIAKNSPAETAGLKAGDVITAVDGAQVSSWEEVRARIQERKGSPISFRVSRSSGDLDLTVTPKEQNTEVGKRFIIGIVPEMKSRRLGVSASFVEAVRVTGSVLMLFWNFLCKLVTGGVERSSLGGVIMIYQATSASAKQGWLALMDLMIMLNLNLFFFNILPIPLLDGGQIYPSLFEMATGIKPGPRFNMVWQYVGLAMLLSLFLLGTVNDLIRVFAGK